MMRLRKYMVYVDAGDFCFKAAIPAENEKLAREYVAGNGEVIAVKDVTDEYPISIEKVIEALNRMGFGETETDLISRTLQSTRIAE